MTGRTLLRFLTALLVAAVATLAVMSALSPRHVVVAQFTNADGLVTGNEVRVHGVVEGRVTSVDVRTDPATGTQFATATLSLDDSVWPLHQGTRVAVKPRGVLSNVYVQIDPAGTGGSALPSGYTFTAGSTTSPINLDTLNDVFTPDVRTATKTQISQGVIALGGGGAQGLATTLDNTGPLLETAAPTTDALAERTPELDRLNAEFDAVTAKLAAEDAHLRSLISNADTVTGVLAANQAALQGTLQNADTSLTEIDSVLTGEQANLEAIFRSGPQALSLAQQNAAALTPLISAINPHVSDLNQLLYEFVTATGFNTNTGGIDTLRIDPTLPPPNHGSSPCGGEPSEQQNACPGSQPSGAP